MRAGGCNTSKTLSHALPIIYKSLPRIPIRNCAVGFLQDLQNVHIFLFRDVDKVFGM